MVDILKNCRSLLGCDGKLVIDTGICTLFSRAKLATCLVEAGLTPDGAQATDSQSIILASIDQAKPVQNGEPKSQIPLWLVQKS